MTGTRAAVDFARSGSALVSPGTGPPEQRSLPDVPSGQSPLTTVLVAIPRRGNVQSLTSALLARGIGRVLQVGSVTGLDEVIADAVAGDLALVSVAFGAPTPRLIQGLRIAGWPRVIALAPDTDPVPLIAAVHAGASGILRYRPAPPVAGELYETPAGARELSLRELEVIQLVADGGSNRWIGDQLRVSPLTVKAHLGRIGRILGTGDRANIVAIALRAELID